jgi:hypothetical protein
MWNMRGSPVSKEPFENVFGKSLCSPERVRRKSDKATETGAPQGDSSMEVNAVGFCRSRWQLKLEFQNTF